MCNVGIGGGVVVDDVGGVVIVGNAITVVAMLQELLLLSSILLLLIYHNSNLSVGTRLKLAVWICRHVTVIKPIFYPSSKVVGCPQ